MVQAMCNSTNMLGNMSLSHSFNASPADDGLSLAFLLVQQFFQRLSSIWNSSGEGRSEVYLETADSKLIFFVQRINGTSPNSIIAVTDKLQNCCSRKEIM